MANRPAGWGARCSERERRFKIGRVLQIRKYGDAGPLVIVLHGGPGAPGSMATVARGLADAYQVLEPLQRGSGDEPLTVATHISDLHEVIRHFSPGSAPALIGSSWGAMLALAYAAAHPDSAGPLILVGCGTFDLTARAQLQQTLRRRLKATADALTPVYSYDPVPDASGDEQVDARAQQETWDDMVRLQAEGIYPAAFGSIKSPVLMVHGNFDPHPGGLIRASLQAYLPQLQYRELAQCGHYPWLEKAAAGAFFSIVREWLRQHAR